jgi:hypothetical protein
MRWQIKCDNKDKMKNLCEISAKAEKGINHSKKSVCGFLLSSPNKEKIQDQR